MKFIFFLAIFFNLNSMETNNQKIVEKSIFKDPWEFISDQVMGGLSKGKLLSLSEDGEDFLRLKGKVSLENNGGFIQFKSEIDLNDNEFTRIRFFARGNNNNYFVHFRTNLTIFPWQYYAAEFHAPKEWIRVDLPISIFKKSNFYQPRKFKTNDINSIGFVAFGKEFDALLDIKDISFVKD